MPPGKEVAAIPRTRKAAAKPAADKTQDLLKIVETSLDDDKAEDIVAIDLRGKSSIADYMVIATGRNSRQLAAMASHLDAKLTKAGVKRISVEGAGAGRLGAARRRRCGGASVPPRSAQLLRAGKDVGRGDADARAADGYRIGWPRSGSSAAPARARRADMSCRPSGGMADMRTRRLDAPPAG